MLKKLPSSLADFVRSHQGIAPPGNEAEYPYSDYYWKPVACALLSGRVRARQQDNLPNRTDLERFCKAANFNQHYFAGVAEFLVASNVIKASFETYERGPHFDDFWSGDLARLQATARDGLVALVKRFTPFHAWRSSMFFNDVVEFVHAFFTAFEGKALALDRIGPAWLDFTKLPEEDLKAWIEVLGMKAKRVSIHAWTEWLDDKGQAALRDALYAAGWAYSLEKDKRDWFCLHTTSNVMLGLADPPPRPVAVTDFKALADLTVLAGVDLSVDTLIPLLRYCRLSRMDRVLTFKLDKKSLRDFPSKTSATQELLKTLQPCEPLPSTVKQFLGDQPRQGGVVYFRYCRGLARVDDPDLLTGIRSHPKLKGYLDRGGPPGYLIIKDSADPNNFIQRCREHGFEVKGF